MQRTHIANNTPSNISPCINKRKKLPHRMLCNSSISISSNEPGRINIHLQYLITGVIDYSGGNEFRMKIREGKMYYVCIVPIM